MVSTLNPCWLYYGNHEIHVHWHFPSFLKAGVAQVDENLAHGRQGPIYSAYCTQYHGCWLCDDTRKLHEATRFTVIRCPNGNFKIISFLNIFTYFLAWVLMYGLGNLCVRELIMNSVVVLPLCNKWFGDVNPCCLVPSHYLKPWWPSSTLMAEVRRTHCFANPRECDMHNTLIWKWMWMNFPLCLDHAYTLNLSWYSTMWYGAMWDFEHSLPVKVFILSALAKSTIKYSGIMWSQNLNYHILL